MEPSKHPIKTLKLYYSRMRKGQCGRCGLKPMEVATSSGNVATPLCEKCSKLAYVLAV